MVNHFSLSRIFGIISVFSIFAATPAWSGSALIEATSGELVARAYPKSACNVKIKHVAPIGTGSDQLITIPSESIQSMAAANPGTMFAGVSWIITNKSGQKNSGRLYCHASTETGEINQSNNPYPNAQWMIPEGKESCSPFAFGYDVCNMFGVDGKIIKNITFYDSDSAADNQVALVEKRYSDFRKSIASGNDTHCGMVIEVKRPLIKIQTLIGEKWFKLEQLFPSNTRTCRFVNGIYSDPSVLRSASN